MPSIAARWRELPTPSDTALANASPNSCVGKIAAYKEAELAAKAAAADAAAADPAVADAQAALDAALAANADDDPLNDVDQATIDACARRGGRGSRHRYG
jgi:hypothetical protein